MKKVSYLTLAFLIPVFLYQCKKDTAEVYDCTGVSPTYNTAVKAILDIRCASAGCHSAASKSEGVDLSSYTGSKSASMKGNFLGSIQHKSGYKAMPQGGSKLDDASIKILSCWVQNGSPE